MANLSKKELDRAFKANEKITECLNDNGINDMLQQGFLSHLLYIGSAAEKLESISCQDIFSGDIELSQSILRTAHAVLNEKVWEQLKEIGKQYSADELSVAAAYAFDKIDILGKYPELGPPTPEALYPVIKELLDIQPGNRVADIGCGCGKVMLFLARTQPKASYYGYEISPNKADIAESQVELSNSKIPVIRQDAFSIPEGERFDRIFVHLPPSRLQDISSRARECITLFKEKCPQPYKGTMVEWALIDMLCDRLTDGGKVVAIMPQGCLSNSAESPARQYFIEKGLLERAITLPTKIQKLTYQAALVTFSRGNKQTHLIDATSVLQRAPHSHIISEENIDKVISAIHAESELGKWVNLEDLKDKDYISRPGLYRAKTGNTVFLSEVVKGVVRGIRYSLDELRAKESEVPTNLRYLTVSNIRDGVIDRNLPYLRPSIVTPKLQKFFAKQNSLLLCKNAPIKIAVASIPKGERILIGNNIYSIELDENKVDSYYLQAFFESAKGMAALEDIAAGTSIKIIGIDRLKQIRIPLPPLEEQRAIAEECRTILNKISKAQLELETATGQLHCVFDKADQDSM